jgi:hypothetical protein
MPDKTETADVAVVGGGIAGVCAAISSARQGAETVLVQDRPVLGGNASSEVRVWVNGATGGKHCNYVREGGIMEELLLQNKRTNPGGAADTWDAVLQNAVREQPRLTCHLNTLITDIEMDGDRIVAAAGPQHATETEYRFEADQFIDATGDGVLAAEAGAEWFEGRESTEKYGEPSAPEERDENTLGSSIMFYSKDIGEPVDYDPPDFAHDFKDDPPEMVAQRIDPQQRRCCYWWIEYGGVADYDIIEDNEAIRDELWAIVYGVWDYIKNSGEFPAAEVASLDLEWVGKVPGKRESRRFIGDYVLTEQDLREQRTFEDAVGHGGWSIDLHPPTGFYNDQGQGADQQELDGPYSFPYRILYTPDLENVHLAGRHVSASHIAFGSLRVQMTLATAGQAAGVGAALCHSEGIQPPAVADKYVETLQQRLLRDDQWIIGVPNRDPDDHAREASVTASSTHPAAVTDRDRRVALDDKYGIHVASEEYLDSVSLLFDTAEDASTTSVELTVHEEDRPENYLPRAELGTVEATLDGPTWVEVPVETAPEGDGVFIVVEETEDAVLVAADRTLSGIMTLPRARDEWWGRQVHHGGPPEEWVPCLRIDGEDDYFQPDAVVDGHSRPYGAGHSWISAPGGADENGLTEEEWVELSWDEPRSIDTVQLTTNTRLSKWYNIFGKEAQAEPETLRDYRIEARVDGDWEPVHEATDNYQRRRRHSFDAVDTDGLRVVCTDTNGASWAELYEVRAYGPDADGPLGER